MSTFIRQVFASAASSPHGLNVGTLADPVRLTWCEVHEQAKGMAGCLAARGIGRHGSVAVLAADAADVAPLAQAIWMRRVGRQHRDRAVAANSPGGQASGHPLRLFVDFAPGQPHGVGDRADVQAVR